MIHITAGSKIYFAHESIDFRQGIDGLANTCRRVIERDPFNGAFFVFKNRSGTQLRILHYDGIGFWLCMRRFSKGHIQWWPKPDVKVMEHRELMVLLLGGNPDNARFIPEWRKVG